MLPQVNDADADGDGVPDVEDICPFDKEVSEFNFASSQLIDLSTFRCDVIVTLVQDDIILISCLLISYYFIKVELFTLL